MCYSGTIRSKPKIAEKPILVYKGTGNGLITEKTFRSWHQTKHSYKKDVENPEVELIMKPESKWNHYNTEINEGYHSWPACTQNWSRNLMGLFVIPEGATYYVNMKSREVVSSKLIYKGRYDRKTELELLKTHFKFKG
jgi:hypothetical protein